MGKYVIKLRIWWIKMRLGALDLDFVEAHNRLDSIAKKTSELESELMQLRAMEMLK